MSRKSEKFNKSDYQQRIKSLERDKKALKAELNKLKDKQGRKNKNLENEKLMRINANKDRYWLRQKLTKMQMAIQARLKALGIDFSNINDLGEALDAAFSAIQKLSAALAEKEDEIAEWEGKYGKLESANEKLKKKLSKFEHQIQNQKRVMEDQKEELEDRDRKLQNFGNKATELSEEHKNCETQIAALRKKLREAKDKAAAQFDKFSDAKQSLEDQLRKKTKELEKMTSRAKEAEDSNRHLQEQLENLNNKLAQMQEENERLQDELDRAREEAERANSESQERISQLEGDLENEKNKNDKLNNELSDLNQKLKDALAEIEALKQKLRNAMKEAEKQAKADAERIKNLENDLSNEKSNNEKLNAEHEALQRKHNDALSDLDKLRQELEAAQKAAEKAAKEAANQIAELKASLENERQTNEGLKNEVTQLKDRVEELEDTLAIQDEEIASYKNQSEEKGNENLSLVNRMSEREQEFSGNLRKAQREKERMQEAIDKLTQDNAEKDNKIEELQKALDEANARWNDHINRPRADKCVQTDITGRWFDENALKIGDIGRLRDENEELARELADTDGKIRNLLDENKQLLDEVDYLLKQAAKFRPDSSNHSGQVLALEASPCKYMCATSATDKSVRLWQINPNEKLKKNQVKVYASSQMEGQALSLAFTKDGNYLAAGTAYKNGPDGAILVWDMTKEEGEVEFLFRSRPTVRFGRVHCLCFSTDGRYIFTGDTTGSVWAWDTQRRLQLAEIKMHKDVCHDLRVCNNLLFSASLDQTISVFVIDLLSKIKINQEKIHLFKPKACKSKTLIRNEKYPYWKIHPTDDCKRLAAGGRKLWIYDFNGKDKLTAGPRASDTDLDHVQSVIVRRNMVCICRKDTPRAKIFDINTGRELQKVSFKQPVTKLGFVYDLRSCVLCIQIWDKQNAKPPSMKLWQFKKR